MDDATVELYHAVRGLLLSHQAVSENGAVRLWCSAAQLARVHKGMEQLEPHLPAAGVTTGPEMRCCYFNCDTPALWQLTTGPTPDDYTHACTGHVGDLLTDAPSTVVTPL